MTVIPPLKIKSTCYVKLLIIGHKNCKNVYLHSKQSIYIMLQVNWLTGMSNLPWGSLGMV